MQQIWVDRSSDFFCPRFSSSESSSFQPFMLRFSLNENKWNRKKNTGVEWIKGKVALFCRNREWIRLFPKDGKNEKKKNLHRKGEGEKKENETPGIFSTTYPLSYHRGLSHTASNDNPPSSQLFLPALADVLAYIYPFPSPLDENFPNFLAPSSPLADQPPFG